MDINHVVYREIAPLPFIRGSTVRFMSHTTINMIGMYHNNIYYRCSCTDVWFPKTQ